MNNGGNNEIGDILSSLDGNQRALAPDFFYTRLKARMEKEQERSGNKFWILYPAIALAVVILMLIINVAILLRGEEKEDTNTLAGIETVQSIVSEYSLNDNLGYDVNPEK